jgi:hypothetical protein
MGLARVADALTHLRDTTPQDVPANPSQQRQGPHLRRMAPGFVAGTRRQ